MATIEERNAGINLAIQEGRGLEAFEEYYDENIVMMENDEAHEGKDLNRKRQVNFFEMVETVHESGVVSTAVNGSLSFTEMFFDFTSKDGTRVKMEEVSVRKWNDDGKIIHERFYYKGTG